LKRVETPEGVLVRELQGESVLLNLDSEAYFGLDDVGTRMWDALAAAGTVEAAYERLLAEFEVDPGRLRADLDAFIETLAGAGLLRVVAD
jgi:hypothetical protein